MKIALRSAFTRSGLLPLALAIGVAAEAGERVREAVRQSLPRYDPAQRETALREAAQAAPAHPVLVRSQPPVEEPPAPPPATDPTIVQLAPFEVRESRPKLPAPLPRLRVPEAHRPGQDTQEPFLSRSELKRRLRKKHLTALESVLNPGGWGDAAAAAAEARLRYAAEVNELADKIDLAALAGASPADVKELRELYLQLHFARPK